MASESIPPPPAFPPGFPTLSDFGKRGIRWGTGEVAALDRMKAITRAELESFGLTADLAKDWANFYRAMVVHGRGNGSAIGRIALMDYCADLLSGGIS